MTSRKTDSVPSARSHAELDCKAIQLAASLLVTAVSVERRLARGLRSHTSR